MISLSEYITEQLITDYAYNSNEEPVNEVLLTCLCYLAAFSIGLKVLHGLSNGVCACWDTIIGNELKRYDSLIDDREVISESRKTLKSKDLFPLQVPDEKTLTAAIDKTDPKEGTDTEKGKGLWTLAKKIKENKELSKVNKGSLKPQYAAIIKKKSYEIVGMFGFSINYWRNKRKSNDAVDKKLAKEYQKYIHIIDIDICPEYDIDTIDEYVWDTIFKVQKELNTKGVTIWCDDDKERREYEKKGFKTIEGHKNIMVCNNKDYKEEEKK